jgi:hypothetical protein
MSIIAASEFFHIIMMFGISFSQAIRILAARLSFSLCDLGNATQLICHQLNFGSAKIEIISVLFISFFHFPSQFP